MKIEIAAYCHFGVRGVKGVRGCWVRHVKNRAIKKKSWRHFFGVQE